MMRLIWRYLLFLLFISCRDVSSNSSSSSSNGNGNGGNRLFTLGVPLKTNPFDEVASTERSWQANCLATLSSVTTIGYGSALVVYGLEGAKGQLRCLTMFRATGHNKLVQAATVAKQNLRDAAFAALWRAPSFVMAHRSLTQLDDRIAAQRAAIQKAKADGTITKREAKMLKAKRKQTIRKLQKDMRRMVRASVNLRHVFQALDFDELMDLTKSFLFQLLAVLTAGDEDKETMMDGSTTSGLGLLVSKWCLFLNLRSLITEATLKCTDPFFVVTGDSGNSKDSDSGVLPIRKTASQALTFGASGYLVMARNTFARHLNAAFLSSAVLLRGLRSFVQAMVDWDDDDDDWLWPQFAQGLDGFPGGLLLVSFAVVAWKSHAKQRQLKQQQESNDDDKKDPKVENKKDNNNKKEDDDKNNTKKKKNVWEKAAKWIKIPLSKLENVIDHLVVKLDNFV